MKELFILYIQMKDLHALYKRKIYYTDDIFHIQYMHYTNGKYTIQMKYFICTIQMEITQCKWKILNTNSNYENSSIHIKFYAIKTECNIIQYDRRNKNATFDIIVNDRCKVSILLFV